MQEKCVCCGAPIPEGRQICLFCERHSIPKHIPGKPQPVSGASVVPPEVKEK